MHKTSKLEEHQSEQVFIFSLFPLREPERQRGDGRVLKIRLGTDGKRHLPGSLLQLR